MPKVKTCAGTGGLALLLLIAAGPAPAQILYYAAPMAGVAGAALPSAVLPPQPAPPPVVFAVPVVLQAAPAQPVVRSYYRVKKGGRLETVGKRMGVAYADLLRLNPGLDPVGVLPAGTMVALPIP